MILFWLLNNNNNNNTLGQYFIRHHVDLIILVRCTTKKLPFIISSHDGKLSISMLYAPEERLLAPPLATDFTNKEINGSLGGLFVRRYEKKTRVVAADPP